MIEPPNLRADDTAPGTHVATHQPGYHRHLYYFYKMAISDVFVSLDNVQFASREWQNRQTFVYDGKRRWLSVPVSRGRETIREKKIVDHGVLRNHWATIKSVYRSTPYFERYETLLEKVYVTDWEFLQDLCDALTGIVRNALGITTSYLRASDLMPHPLAAKGALIAALARQAAPYAGRERAEIMYLACAAPMRPNHYLMQPSAATPGLTERQVLEAQGLSVVSFPYQHPVYPQWQLPPDHPFEAELSAFDLLFNHGPRARGILLGAGEVCPHTDGDVK
ncbi:WbqC family protein [Streptomyces sp. NPDC004647]|uniref:WbqC family protein n=1 Tax=Streptomyces sp. NPDC004647 TaxID=3154671 RepID=UPI0033A87BCA